MSHDHHAGGSPGHSQNRVGMRSTRTFMYQRTRHAYFQYAGGLPPPSHTPTPGDLAQISDDDWRMYDSNGQWHPVAENYPHPTLRDMRLSRDCVWVNKHTISAHRKQDPQRVPDLRTTRNNPNLFTGKFSTYDTILKPALKITLAIPSPVLDANLFLLHLANRWKQPPLAYYAMVSAKVYILLHRLARSASPCTLFPTTTIPYCEQPPTASLLLADLLSLGDDLISYYDLSGYTLSTDTVASVLDLLHHSTLTVPWSPGHKVVALLNIGASPNGLLRCRFDWDAWLGELGLDFAIADLAHQYSEEELAKLLPPASRRPKKPLQKVRQWDALRAKELDAHGKQPYIASVRTPPGWFSDMHVDQAGMSQAMVHCEGEKLWLLWPATEKNLLWWGLQHPEPLFGHGRIMAAVDALEGLQILHLDSPRAFIVPPFSIHAVIGFTSSFHTGVLFAHAAHWPVARDGLDFLQTLIHDPQYPADRVIQLYDRVIFETDIWERATGPDSEAVQYLKAWQRKAAPICEQHKNRNTSTA
ncbi:hypothetical protein DFH06DRAFT_1370697 [Mycena polygramma]|nr:hypothetical protein DFH06DRAFT_1370697 [Mycena polygramma]